MTIKDFITTAKYNQRQRIDPPHLSHSAKKIDQFLSCTDEDIITAPVHIMEGIRWPLCIKKITYHEGGLVHIGKGTTRIIGLPFPTRTLHESTNPIILKQEKNVIDHILSIYGYQRSMIPKNSDNIFKKLKETFAHWADDPCIVSLTRYNLSTYDCCTTSNWETEQTDTYDIGNSFSNKGKYPVLNALPWSLGSSFGSKPSQTNDTVEDETNFESVMNLGIVPFLYHINALTAGINICNNELKECQRVDPFHNETIKNSINGLKDVLFTGIRDKTESYDDESYSLKTFIENITLEQLEMDPLWNWLTGDNITTQPITHFRFELDGYSQYTDQINPFLASDPLNNLQNYLNNKGYIPINYLESLHPLINKQTLNRNDQSVCIKASNNGGSRRIIARLYQPQIIPVPDYYENVYSLYLLTSVPKSLNGEAHLPKKAYICLFCGTQICASDCCNLKYREQLTESVSRGAPALLRVNNANYTNAFDVDNQRGCLNPVERHALSCGGGLILALDLDSSGVVWICANRNPAIVNSASINWGSLHVDENGDDDTSLTRGKTLRLSRTRTERLIRRLKSIGNPTYCDRLLDVNGDSQTWNIKSNLEDRGAFFNIGVNNVLARIVQQITGENNIERNTAEGRQQLRTIIAATLNNQVVTNNQSEDD